MTVRSTRRSPRVATTTRAHHPARKPAAKTATKAASTKRPVRDTFQPSKASHVKRGATPGNVASWIAQAQGELEKAGVPASKMNAADIAAIIAHESSGNPDAQNNWDSNARAGHPSIGLMQTIDSTFARYKLPGHDDIRNPVDNIIAGVRYSIDRYGSISNVPGIEKLRAGRGYVGY
jgi:soluble lytic murein transglycosylase-like protein